MSYNIRQGSGNEGLPMGQSGEKLSRPKNLMLYLFLGQNFPQNPFLKSKMPPEVSFSISHFSIHFFLYKIWQFCSIFVEKKINLPEFSISGLINYILIIVNLLATWEYVFLGLKKIILEVFFSDPLIFFTHCKLKTDICQK